MLNLKLPDSGAQAKDEVKACAGMLESIDVYFRVALDKLNDHRGDLLRMMEDTES